MPRETFTDQPAWAEAEKSIAPPISAVVSSAVVFIRGFDVGSVEGFEGGASKAERKD
jgi:hypothetical protein